MTGLPHRTATTSCPCCIPTLGDSEGASRVAPVRGKGNIEIRLAQNIFRELGIGLWDMGAYARSIYCLWLCLATNHTNPIQISS